MMPSAGVGVCPVWCTCCADTQPSDPAKEPSCRLTVVETPAMPHHSQVLGAASSCQHTCCCGVAQPCCTKQMHFPQTTDGLLCSDAVSSRTWTPGFNLPCESDVRFLNRQMREQQPTLDCLCQCTSKGQLLPSTAHKAQHTAYVHAVPCCSKHRHACDIDMAAAETCACLPCWPALCCGVLTCVMLSRNLPVSRGQPGMIRNLKVCRTSIHAVWGRP